MGVGGARPGSGRKPKADARKPTTLTLHPDMLAALDAAAARDGISRSEAASRMIAFALAANGAPAPVVVPAARAEVPEPAKPAAAPIPDRVKPVPAVAAKAVEVERPRSKAPLGIGDVLRERTLHKRRMLVTQVDNIGLTGHLVDADGAPVLDPRWGRPKGWTYTHSHILGMLARGQAVVEKAMS